jgi:cytochrome c556
VIRNMKLVMAVAGVAALAVSAASVASSSPEGTTAIKARHEAMESIGDAMGPLGAIAKGDAPFDAAVVKENAGTIAENLKKAATLFPEGSDTGEAETWAKAEIWSNHADFELKMQTAQTQAEALAGVTEEAAYRPALGKLGTSCKSCHQDYRRPKH